MFDPYEMDFDPYSNIGEFRHTITFQKFQEGGSDGAGGWIEGGWTDVVTTEALVTPISSREIAQAEQTRNPIDFEVYYPYRTDITPSMRVKYDDVYLSIKTEPMDQGGQHEVMMIECGRGATSDGQK
ncbi:phage head closure protein [Terribacillus saccharophilus]|uniref:phage head closure protein n=1 Tax=Terribacillus saccharophilus TaxID=361277 RepID=UPI00211CA961|nr:phage head closure protein [Terribacillus saccharophilus]